MKKLLLSLLILTATASAQTNEDQLVSQTGYLHKYQSGLTKTYTNGKLLDLEKQYSTAFIGTKVIRKPDNECTKTTTKLVKLEQNSMNAQKQLDLPVLKVTMIKINCPD